MRYKGLGGIPLALSKKAQVTAVKWNQGLKTAKGVGAHVYPGATADGSVD